MPPLTFTVFETFRELWNASDFSFLYGSLVWTGPAHIDIEFCRQAETYLTQAEDAFKAEGDRAQESQDKADTTPRFAARLIVLAIVIGFPIALVIAWAFELTPGGIKRTGAALFEPARFYWVYGGQKWLTQT